MSLNSKPWKFQKLTESRRTGYPHGIYIETLTENLTEQMPQFPFS